MSQFFINRPIFAWVIAIIIMLAGVLAIKTLPVSQYPPIAPPQISINAIYPGASAQTVQDTVTQVIEQKMNGIDNLLYMSSTSDSSGTVTITLTFKAGTDPNIAQVQVQNKLQLATPLLPQVVQRQGIPVDQVDQKLPGDHGSRLGGRQHEPLRSDRLYGGQRPGYHQPGRRGRRSADRSAPSMPCGSGCDPDKLNNYQLTP